MKRMAGVCLMALGLSLGGSVRAQPVGGCVARGKVARYRELTDTAAKEGQIRSIVVSRYGKIVYEFYRTKAEEGAVYNFYSVAKSVTAIIAGIAIDQGAIPGDEALVSDYFPAMKAGDAQKRQIRLKHLLSMMSGISWPESTEWNNFFRPMLQSGNWIDFIASRGMDQPPGACFNYNSGNPHLVSKIVQDATGRNMFEYGKEKLFGPLGMDSVSWYFDPQGVCFGGAWISMTAKDALKLGQLILDEGMWKGQRIVSREWVRKMTTPESVGRKWNEYIGGEYGYGWWINAYRGRATCFAWGANEQYVFVTPSLGLIAVFTSDFRESGAERPPRLYADHVVE